MNIAVIFAGGTGQRMNTKTLPTTAWYTTQVNVLDDAQLVSTGGSVNILSEDSSAAESSISSSSVGVGFNADVTYGSNTINTSNTINFAGVLDAFEAAVIKASSKTDMRSETYADGGGFISGSSLTAESVLSRTVKVTIGDGSSITTNYGDVDILAAGGSEDSIVTISKISSGGFVAMGYATLNTDIDSDIRTSVGSGAEIRSRFNTVNINAEASQTGGAFAPRSLPIPYSLFPPNILRKGSKRQEGIGKKEKGKIPNALAFGIIGGSGRI